MACGRAPVFLDPPRLEDLLESLEFEPRDHAFERRVREGFAAQTFMRTLGASLALVEPGRCGIWLPFREDLCQQDGFLHAGVTTTLADNACGFAALTLMPEDSSVLTVEFKMNLLRPAIGEYLMARATVLKPGRTVTVVRATVSGVTGGEEKPVAEMLSTMMRLSAGPPETREEPAG